MYSSPTADEVRQVVIRIFGQFIDVADVEERLRIEDGKLVARCYRADGLLAMWLIAIDVVQFYDAEGNMLQTVNLRAMMSTDRMAA